MIAIAILAIAFVAGAVVGIAALLRLGIAREECRRSLRCGPGTRSVAATRRVLGLYASPPRSVSHPESAADSAKALPTRSPQTLPQWQSPRQLPAGRPSTRWDGLR